MRLITHNRCKRMTSSRAAAPPALAHERPPTAETAENHHGREAAGSSAAMRLAGINTCCKTALTPGAGEHRGEHGQCVDRMRTCDDAVTNLDTPPAPK
jgi:hypothetical protein